MVGVIGHAIFLRIVDKTSSTCDAKIRGRLSSPPSLSDLVAAWLLLSLSVLFLLLPEVEPFYQKEREGGDP